MKLELGKKYEDENGNLIGIVYQNFKSSCEKDKMYIALCLNEFNYPICYSAEGIPAAIPSVTKNIIKCIGKFSKPKFKKFNNGNGQEVDYLSNFCTKEKFHLGIVHVSAMEDAIRLFKEDGKIVVPLRDSDSDKENLILK